MPDPPFIVARPPTIIDSDQNLEEMILRARRERAAADDKAAVIALFDKLF